MGLGASGLGFGGFGGYLALACCLTVCFVERLPGLRGRKWLVAHAFKPRRAGCVLRFCFRNQAFALITLNPTPQRQSPKSLNPTHKTLNP